MDITALNFTMTAANTTDKNALASSDYNVKAASGGLLEVAAAKSTSTVTNTTSVTFGSGVTVDVVGSTDNPGTFAVNATNATTAADRSSLDAGGAIDVAEADSEYTTDDTATVTVGAATLESVGDISIGAQDSATVATDANAKTYGLAAAAEGNSNSDVTSTNKVEIGNGATLDAGGNVNLDAGQTTSGTTNDFDLTAYTNLWNKTAFPITTKPNAYGTLNQYNQVLVDSGGLVETVKDAYLTATPGAHTVTAYGDGKDLYRERCSARSAAPSARPSAAAACRWTSPPARPRTTPAAAPPP